MFDRFFNSSDMRNSTRGFNAEGTRRAHGASHACFMNTLIISLGTVIAVSIFVALALVIISLVTLLGLIVLVGLISVLISVIIIRFTAVSRPCLATAS